MDPMSYAAVAKAHDALTMALQGEHEQTRADVSALKAKAFREFAARIMCATPAGPDFANASPTLKSFMAKSAVSASAHGEIVPPGSDLAAHWLASIAPSSLLDSMARHILTLPPSVHRVMLASGYLATGVAQGAMKVTHRLGITQGDVEPAKVATMIVATQEMMKAGGDVFLRLLEREMAAAITRAGNASVLSVIAALAGSDSIIVSPTGDPLGDLRAALQASEASSAYAIAAEPGIVQALATYTEAGPDFTIRGGTFRPGVEVVPVEGVNGLTAIPLDRLAMWGGALQLSQSREALVIMDDAPTGNSTTPTGMNPAQAMVSLFQTGSVGLLAERQYHLAGEVTLVHVSGT